MSAPSTYGSWLKGQSPDRQAASLELMQICARLGEVAQTAPRSAEAAELRAEISAH